jgi:type VI secretion system protein ImpE
MQADELIEAGRLSEARTSLIAEVKASPSDLGKRTLLVQVLAFCGEWDKARKHLETIVLQDPNRENGVQVYENLIQAEIEREEVMNLRKMPSFLTEAPPYLNTYFDALKCLDNFQFEQAKELFQRVEKQCLPITGSVNGKRFSGLSDTDSGLGPFVEAIVYERYVWIPFEEIRELSIEEPKHLLDLLWIPARITTWEGLTLNCYLPVLYPGTGYYDDDQVRVGRVTEWASQGDGFSRGLGQHVFSTGEEEISLLDIREAVFDKRESGSLQ